MTNGWMLGVVLGLLLPLPDDIYAAWKWWTKKEDTEFPPPPRLTRQDGAIFDSRAAVALDDSPTYFASHSTVIIRSTVTSLPRTVSTDLGRWAPLDPTQVENPLGEPNVGGTGRNTSHSIYTSFMCLFFRADYPSRRSDR